MKEYIERNELLAEQEQAFRWNNCVQIYESDRFVSCKVIKAAPVADVVEVVRCKDCKLARKMVCGDYFCPIDHRLSHNENDFCSYGARK